MTKARERIISLEATPYYHCVSRCVRKAFLCGKDHATGANYEHRRQWIEERLYALQSVFCIDLCAFAIMSNHFHLVLHINASVAEGLSTLEVIERWHQLFKGTPLTQRALSGDELDKAEQGAVDVLVSTWRERMTDIGWFMRCINEHVARKANVEDKCSGRFWEGRFKSQALLDEKALAACLAYVDLNPVRAKMAATPEESDYTSIQRRITSLKESEAAGAPQKDDTLQPVGLAPFVGNPREPMPMGLPFHLNDYIELVDWTGRQLRQGKRGVISSKVPPVLERLGIAPKHWLFLARNFESRFKSMVGSYYRIKEVSALFKLQRAPSVAVAKEVFG